MTRILRWGNSLVVRISRTIARRAGLKEGDVVELTVSAGETLEVRPVFRDPTLQELIARITPDNRHDEIPVGPAAEHERCEW